MFSLLVISNLCNNLPPSRPCRIALFHSPPLRLEVFATFGYLNNHAV
jgi:hypothetical protein